MRNKVSLYKKKRVRVFPQRFQTVFYCFEVFEASDVTHEARLSDKTFHAHKNTMERDTPTKRNRKMFTFI